MRDRRAQAEGNRNAIAALSPRLKPLVVTAIPPRISAVRCLQDGGCIASLTTYKCSVTLSGAPPIQIFPRTETRGLVAAVQTQRRGPLAGAAA